jgi:arabinofuranosyltransferase
MSAESTEPIQQLTLGTRWRPLIQAGGVVLLFMVALRAAWLCDDAFISFRAAWNLVHGYGLVSNPVERVQGFTNPLWTLLIAALLRVLPVDIYWLGVGAGLICTAALAIVLVRRASLWSAALSVILLSVSSSFAAFSTSGLENSLAHLLLAAFCLESLRAEPRPLRSWLLAGLIGQNRLDHLLLVAPVLLLALLRFVRTQPRPKPRVFVRPALFGLAPLLAWLAFATFYYGFPLPNTGYAKLNSVIPKWELATQGMAYMVDAALRDPIVPATLLLAFVLGWLRRRATPSVLPLVAGVALYVAYLVSVGGDFMSGRLLTPPYLVAVVVVSRMLAGLGPGACLVMTLFAFSQRTPLFEARPVDVGTECGIPPAGIVDERACYLEHTAVAQNLRVRKYRTHPFYQAGLKLANAKEPTVANVVGMLGYAAGPRLMLVDEYGLTDALLARMRYRPKNTKEPWRIGHFPRPIPTGYLETLTTGNNHIQDPCLGRLWDKLEVVTRGRLFEWERLKLIVHMNVYSHVCATPD